MMTFDLIKILFVLLNFDLFRSSGQAWCKMVLFTSTIRHERKQYNAISNIKLRDMTSLQFSATRSEFKGGKNKSQI